MCTAFAFPQYMTTWQKPSFQELVFNALSGEYQPLPEQTAQNDDRYTQIRTVEPRAAVPQAHLR